MGRILTLILILHSSLFILNSNAQVGDYRHVWAIGINGGIAMNKVGFMPDVNQDMHNGLSIGIQGRYTSEKYFSTICSLQMECNLSKLGWKERIETIDGTSVINPTTGVAEEYTRDITYIQIPFLAHLAWGKERNGVNAFINAGPQLCFMTSDKITKNYDKPYIPANYEDYVEGKTRVNTEVAQETMDIKYKFDYGIAFGAGVEWDIKHFGRISLEGRYYYGLGNLYGDSKTDEFGKSNNGTIYVKFAYLKDL